MTRFQVKCRRCRHWLMSEESIVDCHGDSVQGGVAGWDCGDGQDQGTRTHLFVSDSYTPPFIVTSVEQACYTQGKITCPKCQGRLGSFDFLRTNRKCSCRRTLLPPIHILRDRIDLLPSQHPSPLTSAVQVTSGGHSFKDGSAYEGVPEECRDGPKDLADSAEGDVSLENADTKDMGSTETAKEENVTTPENTNTEENKVTDVNTNNRAVEQNKGSQEDEVLDLRWLFGEKTEQESFLDTCPSKPLSSTSTYQSEECSDIAMHDNKYYSVISRNRFDLLSESTAEDICDSGGTLCRNPVQRRSYPAGHGSQTIAPNLQGGRLLATKRAKRRRRSRGWEIWDDPKSIFSCDTSGYPVAFCDARPHLHSSSRQRERERRDWMMEEKRQVQEEEVLWDHTCPMCLDVMMNPHTTLPCRHNFCEVCLRNLTTITSPTKSDCPLCRRRIAQCTPNTEMHQIIQDKYPARLRVRRREEKRHSQRSKHLPLPGLPFPQRVLSHLPVSGHRFSLSRTCKKLMMLVVVNVVLIMALSYLGLAICKRVLQKLAQVYDDLTERLTGERLWSHFMGVESRMLTVSCVFVLYLLVACAVQYLQLFQQIQN